MCDLLALGAAYASNALAKPDLYRTMFDASFDREDPEAAAESFQLLVSCATRARQRGRFADEGGPEAVATQFWAMGHGLTMLVLTGVLPREALIDHVPAMATALFVAPATARTDADVRCRRDGARSTSSSRRH